MKIAIGGDHAGFEYKAALIAFLEETGHEVEDFGAYSAESADYPDFAHLLHCSLVMFWYFSLHPIKCSPQTFLLLTPFLKNRNLLQ